MNDQTITDAFRKLYEARRNWAQASEKTIAIRQALEHERAARLMTGEIAGKNEAEREARARELLTNLYLELEAAERDERAARLAHDLARIEVERMDYLLRWMALRTGGASVNNS
jgi:hypothetical protein